MRRLRRLRVGLPLGASLMLLPAAAGALEGLPRLLRCGEEEVEITPEPGRLRLLRGFERLELVAVPAASGARYEKPGDPPTSFWSKGERATLVLAGKELPECAPAGPFAARGNEPFWQVAVDAHALRLERLGEPPLVAPSPAAELRDGALRWTGAASGREIALAVRAALCRDTMTGMPYPARVTLTLDGRSLEGCGGDPGALLRAREWTVASLDGAPLPAVRPPVRLSFATGGRFAGQGPCNRLLGGYRLTGESLALGPVASTMMACPEAILAAEQALVRALEGVRGFEPEAGSGLVLLGEGGRIALRP